jgi:uncharacterized protein YceH (UPF0502 family)
MDVPRDLTPQEVRVLGCLVEKEATVPDTYPLTLNSLRTACNQSTSRDPVVAYGEREIELALVSLRERGLTRTVHSTSNRATKYRHVLPDALELDAGETALVAVLMLRGAQTIGELKARCERQHAFDSTESVAAALTQLAGREQPLVLQLARQPGQKDARWIHLLAPRDDRSEASPAPGGDAEALRPREDSYGPVTAEFHDLLDWRTWDELGLVLLDVFTDVDPGVGPIVDIGSGTGAGLDTLQTAVPGCAVFAIEPSASMRAGLHARLADRADLAARTTVSPLAFAHAPLPQRACAVLASSVLGHFTPIERDSLWAYIATALPAGAPAVIGLLAPARPREVPMLQFAERRVGDYVYEGWRGGSPIDARRMRWTQRYLVVAGDGSTVAEYHAETVWHCDGAADIQAEIAPFGLVLEPRDGCVVVRRPEH